MTESCSCFTAKEKESEIDFGFVPRSSLERLIRNFVSNLFHYDLITMYHQMSTSNFHMQPVLSVNVYFRCCFIFYMDSLSFGTRWLLSLCDSKVHKTISLIFVFVLMNIVIFPNHSSTFERLKGMSYVHTQLEEKKTCRFLFLSAMTYKISSQS